MFRDGSEWHCRSLSLVILKVRAAGAPSKDAAEVLRPSPFEARRFAPSTSG